MNKKHNGDLTKSQRITLGICIAIMTLAIILAFTTTGFAFYEFMTILAIPLLIASVHIAIGGGFKIVTYLILCLSCMGATIALLASTYWLVLLTAFS